MCARTNIFLLTLWFENTCVIPEGVKTMKDGQNIVTLLNMNVYRMSSVLLFVIRKQYIYQQRFGSIDSDQFPLQTIISLQNKSMPHDNKKEYFL